MEEAGSQTVGWWRGEMVEEKEYSLGRPHGEDGMRRGPRDERRENGWYGYGDATEDPDLEEGEGGDGGREPPDKQEKGWKLARQPEQAGWQARWQ